MGKKDEITARYDCEGDITIYTVMELKKRFLEELNKGKTLELGLGGVSKFDSAGFQLLLYIKREAEIIGKEVKFVNAGNNVSKIFNLFGPAI